MTVKSLKHSSLTDNVFYRSMLVGNTAYKPSDEDVLAEEILTSSQASVTFSGLDTLAAGYRHLQIRALGRSSDSYGGVSGWIILNGDTTSGVYGVHRLAGYGSSVSSNGWTSNKADLYGWFGATNTANAFTALITDIYDFSSTTKKTTMSTLTGAEGSSFDNIELRSHSYNSTDAITSIQLVVSASNFVAGSSFTLIGVK